MKCKVVLLILIALSGCSNEIRQFASQPAIIEPLELIGRGKIVTEQKDWAVKVFAGNYTCTGEAISPQFILTAQHCVTDDDMKVYPSDKVYVKYSNGINNYPGNTKHYSVNIHTSEKGDVALIELKDPHDINDWPRLNFSYSIPAGNDIGVIYGYGRHDPSDVNVDFDALYQANIMTKGYCTDSYGGRGISLRGGTGWSLKGDSGGPLIINGRQVGIDSRGDKGVNEDKGKNQSCYSDLSVHADWIIEKAHPVGNWILSMEDIIRFQLNK
ncbi:S1 family peptidase [Xenorhabdus budapestensis]|uniref:Trypsin n=1 Tax=Xenorhabdus budapestensis TaxID=290110 RepID=A0A2D0IW13_XENBU|nr:trypsin-like serine protease [Xenorhabdus budapestensis]PHM26095.1 trypsin [Xenorhabdus budapestensis]